MHGLVTYTCKLTGNIRRVDIYIQDNCVGKVRFTYSEDGSVITKSVFKHFNRGKVARVIE